MVKRSFRLPNYDVKGATWLNWFYTTSDIEAASLMDKIDLDFFMFLWNKTTDNQPVWLVDIIPAPGS